MHTAHLIIGCDADVFGMACKRSSLVVMQNKARKDGQRTSKSDEFSSLVLNLDARIRQRPACEIAEYYRSIGEG